MNSHFFWHIFFLLNNEIGYFRLFYLPFREMTPDSLRLGDLETLFY